MPATATDRIDGLTTSVAVKAPCRVATTANITLSGLQTIAGVTVVEGDRVLVKDQTSSVNNGIYVASTSAWERARDFDGARDVVQGTLVAAYSSTGEETMWRVTTANPITIGSSAIVFEESVLLSAAASAVSFLQSGTGAVTRTVQDKLRDGYSVSIKDFGAACDNVTDDTAAVQACFDAIGDTSIIQRSGIVVNIPGPTVITSTITIRRKSIVIQGGGWGTRNDTGARACYLRWDGAAGSPMLKVQDVVGFAIRDLRFIGKSASKPTAAINFNETNDGWPLSSIVLDNVYIGSMSGETDDAQQFTHGVLLDGIGANNSEHVWTNVKINKVASDGIHIGSVQNVNIAARSLFLSSCARSGIYNSGHIWIDQMSCAANAVDFYTPLSDDNAATVDGLTHVTGYFSEQAGRLSEHVGTSNFTINGGSFQITSSLNADGKVIKAEGATANYLRITGLRFGQGSAPPASPYLSLPTGASGERHIVIQGVTGWSVLTGGANGMDLTTTNPGRTYVEFSEDPRSTGVGYPARTARNFLAGSGQQWNIQRYDVLDNTTPRLFDDFLGDVLQDPWGTAIGSDGACVAATVTGGLANGIARLTTGAGAGATMAVNGTQLHSALNWTANQGPVVFECRVKMSAITSMVLYVGFTDQVGALEMPFTLAAGDVLTSNTTDGAGWLFDTDADNDNWWLVGVATNVDATKQNSAIAPVAATYEVLRVSLEGAVATFYRNGVKIGTAMTGAVSGAFLTPVIAAFSRTNASRTVDVDYILVQSSRSFP